MRFVKVIQKDGTQRVGWIVSSEDRKIVLMQIDADGGRAYLDPDDVAETRDIAPWPNRHALVGERVVATIEGPRGEKLTVSGILHGWDEDFLVIGRRWLGTSRVTMMALDRGEDA